MDEWLDVVSKVAHALVPVLVAWFARELRSRTRFQVSAEHERMLEQWLRDAVAYAEQMAKGKTLEGSERHAQKREAADSYVRECARLNGVRLPGNLPQRLEAKVGALKAPKRLQEPVIMEQQ